MPNEEIISSPQVEPASDGKPSADNNLKAESKPAPEDDILSQLEDIDFGLDDVEDKIAPLALYSTKYC